METIDICAEVQQNFLDSSYDTNFNRAFPDARDGLKPGQRACLWEMWKKGYLPSKPHVKSAKISGGVCATWWPHSNVAIYETFARMAQDFSNNNPEVDFHGSYGNMILGGDAFANERYTEARLSNIAIDGFFCGIDKNAVDMQLNFTEDEEWPVVLAGYFPRLLVNGCQGIGVSMQNYWCQHSLNDTADVLLKYIDTGEVDCRSYLPDFPTGGTIVNSVDELEKINSTGKGKIVVEASYSIKGSVILFTEMPFQVYIEDVRQEIKDAIDAGKVANIKNVLNKSDKTKIELEVECTRGADPSAVLEALFKQTHLRSQYDVNQMCIIGKTPKLMTLADMCDVYVSHNVSCIDREFRHDLAQAESRIHILEGLSRAVEDIDSVIAIIKDSSDPDDAKANLMQRYSLDEEQAKSILAIKLATLSKVQKIAIDKELDDKRKLAAKLSKVVSSDKEKKKILVKRLTSIRDKYGSPRRTKIEYREAKRVVLPNAESYTIDVGFDTKTVKKIASKDGTYIDDDYIVAAGIKDGMAYAYRIKVEDIPACRQSDAGISFNTLIGCDISAAIDGSVVIVTALGKVKAISLSDFAGNVRNKQGMEMIKLSSEDRAVSMHKVSDATPVCHLLSDNGYEISFFASEISTQKKTGGGVIGIKLEDGDRVVGVRFDDDSSSVQRRGGRGRLTTSS